MKRMLARVVYHVYHVYAGERRERQGNATVAGPIEYMTDRSQRVTVAESPVEESWLEKIEEDRVYFAPQST